MRKKEEEEEESDEKKTYRKLFEEIDCIDAEIANISKCNCISSCINYRYF